MQDRVVTKTNVALRMTTREALRNLFPILGINGGTFDDNLMELATRAFSANADLALNRKTLATREAAGHKVGRRQMEIKETTFNRLKDLHGKLYPYLPWTSWTWYLEQLADMAEDKLHVKRDELDVYSG